MSHPLVAALLAWTLDGPWEASALKERFARCIGAADLKAHPWLRDVARRLVRRPREPIEIEHTLTEAVRRVLGRELPRVRRLPLGSPRMGEAPFAAWPVPTVGDLAALVEVDVRQLAWLADLRAMNERARDDRMRHYVRRWVPKRSGQPRLLESPKPTLKRVQRQLLATVFASWPTHDAACGFVTGRGVLDHARAHAGRRVVVRMDLADFFTSISLARVRGLLRAVGYPDGVAGAIAGLTCVSTPHHILRELRALTDPSTARAMTLALRSPHLPQGAPTSPLLSNLVARRLDQRLGGLAARFGARYSRYADDLAFSGDAAFERGVGRFLPRAAAVVLDEGFTPNHRKTRVMRSARRQELCGVVVNTAPGLRRTELERLEAILVNCARHGPSAQNRDAHPDFRAHLAGRVAWVHHLAPHKGERLRALFDRIVWP
ncbi:MAG: reverse transcriptase family protein [Sandaracinaceae bacterium]